MIFEGVQILITTSCDRSCVDCCQQIPRKFPGKDLPWEDFEKAAMYIRGYPICVCGGEATIHPDFARIAREFRSMFDAPWLEVATNGCNVIAHGVKVLRNFDLVRITNYPQKRTQEAITWAKANIGDIIRIEGDAHIPLSQYGGGAPCDRSKFPIYQEGQLYPCCVATGFEGTPSLPICPNWEELIDLVPLPCERCVFSL